MLALLPMKKISERVPNKNIKLLHGKPLYEYVLDMLQNCNTFDFTVVNTDCEYISDMLQKRYGDFVKIIERPDYLCGNDVSMNRIIEYDISIFKSYNKFLQTHSTNPLLTKTTVLKALNMFENGIFNDTIDSLFSVNVIQSRLYNNNINPINHSPNTLIKTQDLEEIYEENSCFYVFSKEGFEKTKSRIGSSPGIYKMSRSSLEAIEIDTPDDWALVDKIMKA
jgi:CMP-N-acetylneuraminic acid synthetase